MGRINVLGFDIANLIAAGEVVDRPSSVVKELMENAIDAGARSITVEIRNGGTTLIRVSDDGGGIEKDDLPVAVLRHATSKIRGVTDLSQIMTLGFRGEALAAIAAVSRLRITSKTPDAALGATLTVEYGEISDLSDAGCPDGTTVVCEKLFANVPARRKFLKKDSTETAAVTAVVEKIALSSPNLAIRYVADGETKFQTPGSGDLTSVIYVIYGREIASRLRPVGRSEGGLAVEGFISEPDLFRPNRNMMNFFINGRYVKSRTMAAAVEQAYATHIPPDKFPFCIINFTINPQAVDVNVHPSKLEVKFTNERLVFEAVYYAVLNALESAGDRPQLGISSRRGQTYIKTYGAPMNYGQGESSPANAGAYPPEQNAHSVQRNAPSKGGNQSFWVTGEEAAKLMGAFASGERSERGVQMKLGENTLAAPGEIAGNGTGEQSAASVETSVYDDPGDLTDQAIAAEADAFVNSSAPPVFVSIDDIAPLPDRLSDPSDNEGQSTAMPDAPAATPEEASDAPNAPGDIAPHGAYDFAVDSPEENAGKDDRIPEYTILGEAYNCYIVVQLEDRLVFIDKHAAHERIIFDSLVEKMKRRERNSQLLMFPVEIPLTDPEKDALAEFAESIRAIGFDFTLTDGAVSLTALPEELSREAATDMIVDLAGSLSENLGTIESVGNEYFEARLYQASCKAAIKGGRVYAADNLRYICDRILREPRPGESAIKTCPHGRPVAFELKKSSIERQFQRLV